MFSSEQHFQAFPHSSLCSWASPIDNVLRNFWFHKNSLLSGLQCIIKPCNKFSLSVTEYKCQQTPFYNVKFVLLQLQLRQNNQMKKCLYLFTKFTFLKARYLHYITVFLSKKIIVKYGRVLLTVIRLFKLHASNTK